MPKPIHPIKFNDLLTEIICPIQSYADILQTSVSEDTFRAGYVLDVLCDDAHITIKKLSETLADKFNFLTVERQF